MWIDPEDTNKHRLFAVGAYDNVQPAQKKADAYDLTRTVLRYGVDLIENVLENFQGEDTHACLQEGLKTCILFIFQIEQLEEVEKLEARSARGWIRTKIFLDHDLLYTFLKVTECHFGSHFGMTQAANERVFSHIEWTPVSTFCYPS